MNKSQQKPQPARSIRIMLHAEDGLVPYLTPDLLERCFPPEDVWCLAIAVNDTCIEPIYSPDSQKHPPSSTATKKNHPASKKGGTKPRGYTFTATGSYQLDAWLYPYERVAVPTFDNRAPSSVSQPGDVSSVAKNVLRLWTANGRHNIDLEQYTQCATRAILAHHVVSLYDRLDDSLPTEKFAKHKTALLQQNQLWMQEQKHLCLQQNSSIQMVWFPFAVASDTDFEDNPIDQKHLDWIGDQLSWLASSEPASVSTTVPAGIQQGIMLAGWHHLVSERSRLRVLQSLQKELDDMTVSAVPVGTISTSSTRQILELLHFFANRCSPGDDKASDSMAGTSDLILIGTNLPSTWAKAKKCFVVDIETMSPTQICPLNLDLDGCWNLNPISVNGSCQPVNEHPFYFDQCPLVSQCSCLTCMTYSRAYLFHLVCSKELLAEILLFIHNFHHLLDLIRTLNVYLEEGDINKLVSLCHCVQSQLGPAEVDASD